MRGIPSKRMFTERPPGPEEALAASPQAEQAGNDLAATSAPGDLLRPMDEAMTVPPVSVSEVVRPTHRSLRDLYSSPENRVFKVVFFPDRIFHAQYLNASRVDHRYRYAVSDARSVLDITVMKASVFMDGVFAANLIRIEYRGSRLIELARESGRFLRDRLIAWVTLRGFDDTGQEFEASRPVKLQHCPWIDSYQVEIWSTLEPPQGTARHDFQVTSQMGPTSPITRIREFGPLMDDLERVKEVELAFREDDIYEPYGAAIANPRWDNNFERSYQKPVSPVPNSHSTNTVNVNNYFLSFRNAWFLNAADVKPVRYRNAMMDQDNPDFVPENRFPRWMEPHEWEGDPPTEAFSEANVIEMKWLLQRELGGSMVFFHEVTIPSGTVEGTHQHIGSEELYYIVSGEGLAYMAKDDDPELVGKKVVTRRIYGLFDTECVEMPVGPGNVIFTKSGGIHGILNTGDEPLKFVAFLYHSV